MKRSILVMAVASAFFLASGAALAQRGQGGPKAPKVKVSQPAPKGGAGPKVTAATAPKAHPSPAPKVHASQGPKVKSTTASTTKAHGPHAAATTQKTQTTKTHGKPAAATTVTTTKTTGPERGRTTTTTTSTAPVTGTTVTLSPVQQKLQKNTNLASKLEGRLPKGTDLLAAAEGFRNLGQFVAAVNVSNNLGIPFVDLKTRMVDDGMSLGQAIQAERQDVDHVTTIVQRAERDAQTIITDADQEMAAAKTKDAKAPKTKKGGSK